MKRKYRVNGNSSRGLPILGFNHLKPERANDYEMTMRHMAFLGITGVSYSELRSMAEAARLKKS